MEFIIILPDPNSWPGAMVDKGAPDGGQHDDSQTWRSDRDGKRVWRPIRSQSLGIYR